MKWLPPFDTPLGHVLVAAALSLSIVAFLVLIANMALAV